MYETTTSHYQGVAKRLLEHGVVKWWVHGKTRACSKPPYHSHETYKKWITEGIQTYFLLNPHRYRVVILDRGNEMYLGKYKRGYILFGLEE